jgi:thiol-disulfide isomerase/thioredoxin
MKRGLFFFLVIFFTVPVAKCYAQKVLRNGIWYAELVRHDSIPVVFNFEVKDVSGKKRISVLNATEKLVISSVVIKNDSVNFAMPVFESEFKTKIQEDGSLTGTWIKGTAGKTQYWPFRAYPGTSLRFKANEGNAKVNITGKWAVTFTRPNNTTRPAVAEFVQKGNYLTGTFLTPAGDYRYLEGIVTGDSLKLSTFDGAHAYVFTAKANGNAKITGGMFYSGIAGKEGWVAVKDATAELSVESSAVYLKDGGDSLDFRFPDLDSNLVSLRDSRFKDKVIIVQLMGSWCPNCMDETKFLSEFYSSNKHRGIEVIALAYEYSTDFYRSQKSMRKFQQRFNVQYPMLITPASVSDSLRTEKTLPQLTPIKSFPTTIYLDKKGKVKKIHTGFYGPGTGKYFEEFKKEFNQIIDELLKAP